MKRALTTLALLPLLAACALAPQPESPARSAVPSSAQPSEISVRGTIRPIQVRLYDVGTHVLVDGKSGELLYILASSIVDLGAHLGEEVTLKGTTMPLGSGTDTLLSVSSLTATGATAPESDVIATAKRLAASFSPPYTFLATDAAEVVSTTGDYTVVRVHQSLADYRLTLRQRDGAWALVSVDVLAPTPAPSSPPSSPPSSISLIPSSTPAPSSVPPSVPTVTPDDEPASSAPPSAPPSVVRQSVQSDSPTVTALVERAPEFIEGLGLTGSVRVTRVSTTENKQAYIELSDGTTRGMVLVGWTSDPAGARVLATFVPGETSDWKKASGDNVARDEAVTIYTLKSGAWTAEVKTAAGYAVYKNAALKLTLQYPSQWYYSTLSAPAPATSRLAFSNAAVTAENALLTLDVVPGSIDAVVGGYSGVAATTINGQPAFRGTVASGATVVILPRNASSVLVLTATPAAASRLDTIAASVVNG